MYLYFYVCVCLFLNVCLAVFLCLHFCLGVTVFLCVCICGCISMCVCGVSMLFCVRVCVCRDYFSSRKLALLSNHLKPPQSELQPWESWEMEDSEYKSNRNRNKSESSEQEPDIDFFQDMAPKIKKTTKVSYFVLLLFYCFYSTPPQAIGRRLILGLCIKILFYIFERRNSLHYLQCLHGMDMSSSWFLLLPQHFS